MLNLYKARRVLVAAYTLSLLLMALPGRSQVTGSFTVQGTLGTYYPVTFLDGGWNSNTAVEMTLGRSNVHGNSSYRGSIIGKFRFHATDWGNGAFFIDADLRQAEYAAVTIPNFVGGWQDVSITNASNAIVIWLMGGGTTYYYNSNYYVTPTVYDGVANALPYAIGGTSTTLGALTAPQAYVNTNGISTNGNLYVNGGGTSYVAGALAIATTNPQGYSLAVNGSAIFTKAVVKTYTTWPDYVFGPDYRPMDLDSLQRYVHINSHLPDIPSAEDVNRDGQDLGEMNKRLLQKVEDLTLYILEQRREIEALKRRVGTLEDTRN